MTLATLICALTITAVVAQNTAPECINQVEKCPAWAAEGECNRNPVWMHPNCPVSCGLCGKDVKCVDGFKEDCPMWAKSGECKENRIWMFFNCPKTCGTCGVKFTG